MPCHTPVPIVPTVTRFAAVVIEDCVPPVTVAAVPEALPVTLPSTAPVNCVAVIIPELGLYVKPVSDSIPWAPVAPSTKTGYTVSFVELFADTVISGAVDADVNAVAQVNAPLPSVCKNWLAVPSSDGNVNVTLDDTVVGAWIAT